jgi:NADH:ubiquinone oxidoreductase subunit H
MTDWIEVLIVAVKVVVAFGFLLVATLLLIWAERKILADMQNRVGPDRAGPWGLLQSLADGIKLFFKEQITPTRAEKVVYLMAPVMALLPALLIFLVIPIGRPFHLGDFVASHGFERWAAVHPRHVVDGGLCGSARRVVLWLQIPAHRWNQGGSPGHQLRSCPRPVAGSDSHV